MAVDVLIPLDGWGAGYWSDGKWNDNPINFTATTSLGSVTTSGIATVSVTGVTGTTELGDARAAVFATVSVTGVTGTTSLGTVIAKIDGVYNVSGVYATAYEGNVTYITNNNISVSGVVAEALIGQYGFMEAWIGWGSGPWSRGQWGIDVFIAAPVGVDAQGEVGDVSFIAHANVYPTGVTGVTVLGTAQAEADADVLVTSVFSTGYVGTVGPVTGTANVYPDAVVGTAEVGQVDFKTVNYVFPAGQVGYAELGDVTLNTDQVLYVSGLEATTYLGTATTIATATVYANNYNLTGITFLGDVIVYENEVVVEDGVTGYGEVGTITEFSLGCTVFPTGVVGTTALGTASVITDQILDVTGLSATAYLGTASTSAGAKVYPAGVVGTTYLGTASTIAKANVYPIGVQGTGIVSSNVLLWSLIDNSQNPNWTRIAA